MKMLSDQNRTDSFSIVLLFLPQLYATFISAKSIIISIWSLDFHLDIANICHTTIYVQQSKPKE
jgi:hypothetical protein